MLSGGKTFESSGKVAILASNGLVGSSKLMVEEWQKMVKIVKIVQIDVKEKGQKNSKWLNYLSSFTVFFHW